jgi:apolipoprotein D and lipocalin family protein
MPIIRPADFKLERYMGRWYQFGATPRRYEPRNSYNVLANYELEEDGTVTVRNQLFSQGKTKSITGQLTSTSDPNRFRLRLKDVFLGFDAKADYVVNAVYADNKGRYQSALVSSQLKDGEGGFYLLSRKQSLDCEEQRFLLDLARSRGYNLENFRPTAQVCIDQPLRN